MEMIVQGTALYVRQINKKIPPKQFAERLKAMGLSWVALAGPWQQAKNGAVQTTMMNSAQTVRLYADACAAEGLVPYVWGYPWVGAEALFIRSILECSGDHKLILLDPEKGMNPSESLQRVAMQRAEASAREIVERIREGGAIRIGLSTYGIIPSWFPITAFLKAGLDFFGGQTYTDDATVDRSIAMFLRVMAEAGVQIQLVPNFGLYSWTTTGGDRQARSKTPEELSHHMLEFVNEAEPVEALIGWAENFAGHKLKAPLLQFSQMMARGAFCLPAAR